MLPKIAGITRVRNEGHIIKSWLDYYQDICTLGIFVYDDCSTDNTKEICESHPAVAAVISGEEWVEDAKLRGPLEGSHRRIVHEEARKHNPDWILCIDADEFIEFDFDNFDYDSFDVVKFKLFDFYITPEDFNKPWHKRRWIGPEFRRIPMLIREHPDVYFYDRPMRLMPNPRVANEGYVKHYGKAISIKNWEEKCEYYSKHRLEPYTTKWELRKGRAVHDGYSDFGNELILWEEKEEKGFMLSKEISSKETEFWSGRQKYTRASYLNDLYSKEIRHTDSREHFEAFHEELGRDLVQLNQNLRTAKMKFVKPKGKVIELGCHCGFNLIHFAEQGYDVTGVEISSTLIDEANRRISELDEDVRNRITIIHSWIEDLETDEKYDTIILTDVLEHVINPLHVLQKAKSILSDDGLIYINVPAIKTGTNAHLRGINSEEILELLRLSSLKLVWESDRIKTQVIAAHEDFDN